MYSVQHQLSRASTLSPVYHHCTKRTERRPTTVRNAGSLQHFHVSSRRLDALPLNATVHCRPRSSSPGPGARAADTEKTTRQKVGGAPTPPARGVAPSPDGLPGSAPAIAVNAASQPGPRRLFQELPRGPVHPFDKLCAAGAHDRVPPHLTRDRVVAPLLVVILGRRRSRRRPGVCFG